MSDHTHFFLDTLALHCVAARSRWQVFDLLLELRNSGLETLQLVVELEILVLVGLLQRGVFQLQRSVPLFGGPLFG